MTFGEQQLESIANFIVLKLKEEFAIKHLSKNLINTIKVNNLGDTITIEIPAQTYNMLLFQTQGVVVHTSNGSYADKLDEEGSEFYVYPNGVKKGAKRVAPHNHKDYIDRVIHSAIAEWTATVGANNVSVRY